MGLGIWAWDAFGVPWGWAQRLGLKAPGAYGAIKQRALGGSSWGMGALRAPLGRMGPSAPLGDQGALRAPLGRSGPVRRPQNPKPTPSRKRCFGNRKCIVLGMFRHWRVEVRNPCIMEPIYV